MGTIVRFMSLILMSTTRCINGNATVSIPIYWAIASRVNRDAAHLEHLSPPAEYPDPDQFRQLVVFSYEVAWLPTSQGDTPVTT